MQNSAPTLPRSFTWGITLVLLGGNFTAGLTQDGVVERGREPPTVQTATAPGGMVVSASPHASEIGADVLSRGGTAVDAAVAVALAMAVTWPEAGNIGGGGFMMVHSPSDQRPICIEYRECAPLRATATLFQRGDSTLSGKAVGVPGTVRGLHEAHRRYGRLPWRELVLPAVHLARDGFLVDEHLAASLNGILRREVIRTSEQFAEFRRVYGKPDGSRWSAGDTLQLPDLARTLQAIAEEGSDGFYRGWVADRLVDEMERSGGLITHRDLAEYEAVAREPIHVSFRGYDVWGPPPPSSGGICLALMLRLLEPQDLREMGRQSPEAMHWLTEVMRRAYAERARHLGDPAFTPIPGYLQSAEFARRLAAGIESDRATASEALAGEIRLADESDSTTHFSVIDKQGMAVSNTYTLEASFGSCVVVRGAGFILNNEMGDFNWFPGVTTSRGRIGTLPNIVAPRKRMLSSQTPVIVTRDGAPVLLTGSPGGRTIINTVLGIVLNRLEFGLSLEDAVAAPRFHHQWLPDELVLEPGEWEDQEGLVADLRAKGHRVTVRQGNQGAAHSISIDLETGGRIGVADWRRGGRAVPEGRAVKLDATSVGETLVPCGER